MKMDVPTTDGQSHIVVILERPDGPFVMDIPFETSVGLKHAAEYLLEQSESIETIVVTQA